MELKRAHFASQASLEDRGFVERLRSGDEAAFDLLVQRHHGEMVRFAEIFVSRAMAEDVVQETWTAIIEGIGAFAARSSLKAWIFQILANRAKTRGVRESRSVLFSSYPEEEERLADRDAFGTSGAWRTPPQGWDFDTPEKLVMEKQVARLLRGAIGQLPAAQRAVVSLRDIEGLSSDEVCNILEISETNQRVLLHRARVKLRGLLAEHFEEARDR